MKLLHWCTLTPEGPSGLAAIRFAQLVRVSSIRVFPKGAKPFEQCPDIIGETEPESFLLDVYLNAQPIQPSSESKEKQRAANALVPTTIAYAGGQVDFTVDLGTEYATRLMIVKGQYDALSLAIYGHVVSESDNTISGEADFTTSKPVPSVETRTLSTSLNPISSMDPTFLARNLLSLLDDSPPLSLVIKLMFCLKPDNDDWDNPEFPYLFVDFDRDIFDTSMDGDENGDTEVTLDLETILDAFSRPVSDSLSEEMLTRFAEVVAVSIGPKSSSQAFHISKLFKLSASQRPSLALALCQAIDPQSIFDAQSLDEDTLLHLLDASANADIARYLHTDAFLSTLNEFQSPAQTRSAKQVAQRLTARIQAWDVFEDALTNTQADFAAASSMLHDIGSGEQSLGIWLISMTGHLDLVTKLEENPIVPSTGPGTYPRLFLRNGANRASGVSHDEFIAFVRAFIGVASVLAVWAWSDSLGNDVCRERVLGVLRLWQSTDGYQEIVNYLLLLRQFTLRLKWITSNDTPRKSGIFGEQILSDLIDEPEAALNDDLIQTILSLKQPLSHIAESDRLSMRKIALVVEDGLPAAIEEITQLNTRPLSFRRLRILRVSIALVARELVENTEKGDWNILQIIWDEQSMALVPRLAELLREVAQDLNGHFLITSPFPVQPQTQSRSSFSTSLPQVLSQLFRLAEDLLATVLHLLLKSASTSSGPASLSFSVTTHTLRSLVFSVADVFACTDAADTIYAQGTPACLSAQSARQTCLEFVRSTSSFGLGGVIVEPIGGKSGAEIVMSVLLKHGIASAGRDPAYHLVQMFALIDHVLPESSSSTDDQGEQEKQNEHWVTQVLPNVLDEAQEFFRQLDVENKVHFLRRLVRLDSQGLVGMADWLFTEEMKLFERCVKMLSSLGHSMNQGDADTQMVVLLYQIGLQVRLIGHMLQTGSDMLEWCIGTLKSVPEAFNSLSTCLTELLDARVVSPHLKPVARTLLFHCDSEEFSDDKFRFTLIVFNLRMIRLQEGRDTGSLWAKTLELLKSLNPRNIDTHLLRLDVGEACATISLSDLTSDSSSAILSLMEWLIGQPWYSTMSGIKIDTLSALYDMLSKTLPQDRIDALEKLRATLIVDEDEAFVPTSIIIPDTLRISLQELQSIISSSSPPVLPSTPTRNNIPDVLGLVISPPAALLRSPAATGLTKTYLNNDFRELRQAVVARQNTSRLPSMHVDVGINGQLT